MVRSEDAASRGHRRGRQLIVRLVGELVAARGAAGLSIREIARRLGCSHDTIRRLERGDGPATSIELIARYAAVVGLRLAANLYPDGDPVRDRAHLALLGRFRKRLHSNLRWRVEVPIPIAGDQRSGDAVIEARGWDALVEAETQLADIQLLERRGAAKARDLRLSRFILLVADTDRNREVIGLHPELRERFPIDTRRCLKSLGRGGDPGGDCLVIL
jgi:transcriptional regulator with XRE-family HTH domain